MEQGTVEIGDVLEIHRDRSSSLDQFSFRLLCLDSKGKELQVHLRLNTAKKLFSMLNFSLKD